MTLLASQNTLIPTLSLHQSKRKTTRFGIGDCSLKCLKCLKSFFIHSSIELRVQQHYLMLILSHLPRELSHTLHHGLFHLFNPHFFLLQLHFHDYPLHVFFFVSSHRHCLLLPLLIILSIIIPLTYILRVSVTTPSNLPISP